MWRTLNLKGTETTAPSSSTAAHSSGVRSQTAGPPLQEKQACVSHGGMTNDTFEHADDVEQVIFIHEPSLFLHSALLKSKTKVKKAS